jgi:hypothetical protein
LVVTSSDPTVIAAIGVNLSIQKEGTATITATYKGITDSVEITALASLTEPAYKAATIADVYNADDTTGKYAYKTTIEFAALLSGKTDISAYGNFMAKVDDTTQITVYGTSAQASALSFNLSTMTYKFTNPQDALTNAATKDLKVGDKLDVIAIRADYGTKKEISCIVLAVNGVSVANAGTAAAPLTTDVVAASTLPQKLYTYLVKGKITGWSNATATDGTAYGNFYLQTEGATKDPIYVYGATADATKLAYDATKGRTVFTNPQDFLTNAGTKDLKIGDEVTMMVIRCDYNGTLEVSGVVIPTVVAKTPVIDTVTIADLRAKTASDNKVVKVSGIFAKITNSTNGNGFLVDPVSGSAITIYGSTKTAANLVKTDTGLGYYTGAWTKPTDFATAGATVGDYVTMEAVYTYFSGTPEISGVIVADVLTTDAAYTYKFSASAAEAENGTVALDKESNLAFGETVKVTATPATGYKVDTVTVARGFDSADKLTAAEDGTYSFQVNVTNYVVVKFVSATAAVTSLNLTVDTLSQPSGAYTVSNPQTISGVAITATGVGNYSNGLQYRVNATTGLSAIYNTSATPTAIKSITVTETTGKLMANGKKMLTISGATAATATPVDTDVVTADGTTAVHVVNFTQAQGMTFFNVGHHSTNTGTFYIASIVVELYLIPILDA